jgi:4'-phosphopantetheinyl transferase
MTDERTVRTAVRLTYCMTADMDHAAIGAAVGQLSVEERSRHDRFVSASQRRDFAVAHALLRRCLSAHGDREPCQWRFVDGPYGKPSLTPEDIARTRLAFNLAHTNGLVACVVSRDVPVGVDVEDINRRTDALAVGSRFFSTSEAAALSQVPACDRHTRCIELWTLKEAFVKAIGEGLSCPLHEFSFTFGDPPSLGFEWVRQTSPAFWCFALFAPSDGHRMAIAVGPNTDQRLTLDVRIDTLMSPPAKATITPLRATCSSD